MVKPETPRRNLRTYSTWMYSTHRGLSAATWRRFADSYWWSSRPCGLGPRRIIGEGL